MPLVKCPKCGKKFSDRIDVCPECGLKKDEFDEFILKEEERKQAEIKRKNKETKIVLFILVGVFVILYVICEYI